MGEDENLTEEQKEVLQDGTYERVGKPRPQLKKIDLKMQEEKELLRSTCKQAAFDSSKPLVLTTKRLIIGDKEIMLSDILEAYNKTHGVFVVASRLSIRLKDGSEIECTPRLEKGSFGGMLFNPELELSKNVERWVSLISRALMSSPLS